jgi:hypothetical protein
MQVRLGLATLGFTLGVVALAFSGTQTQGTVVSIDAKTKTMTLGYKDPLDNDKYTESSATWDEQTIWCHFDNLDLPAKPVSADLVKTLKKSDRIYLAISHKQGTYHLDRLCTLPSK